MYIYNKPIHKLSKTNYETCPSKNQHTYEHNIYTYVFTYVDIFNHTTYKYTYRNATKIHDIHIMHVYLLTSSWAFMLTPFSTSRAAISGQP